MGNRYSAERERHLLERDIARAALIVRRRLLDGMYSSPSDIAPEALITIRYRHGYTTADGLDQNVVRREADAYATRLLREVQLRNPQLSSWITFDGEGCPHSHL